MTFKVYPNLQISIYMDFKSGFEMENGNEKIFESKNEIIKAELIKFQAHSQGHSQRPRVL
jgi:hypothetical protein